MNRQSGKLAISLIFPTETEPCWWFFEM